MTCQEVVCVWDKNINSWISEVKQYEGNYGKRVKPKWEKRVSNRWNHIRKRGFTLNGCESRALDFETWTLNKSDLDLDKQLCYCTCLREMFVVNYLRGKYDKPSAAPLMPSIVFFNSPLRFLTVLWKAFLTELFFKMQFVKNILVYVICVFTISFCYSFYEMTVLSIKLF